MVKKTIHALDEALELLAMGRLLEPELGTLEEHLLICVEYQDRLDAATEYSCLARQALTIVALEIPVAITWREWISLDWLPVPRFPVGVFMVLIMAWAWQSWQPAVGTELLIIELQTMRGGAVGMAGAAGFAIRLRLDVSGLDTPGQRQKL